MIKHPILKLVIVISLLYWVAHKSITSTETQYPVQANIPSHVDKLSDSQREELTKRQALALVTIAKYNWYMDYSILTATFIIKNDGDVPVKDLEVKCTHYGSSGTEIDSNTRTIYQVFPAHKTRTIRGFNMGFIASQAATSGCHIEDLVVVNE
jgi:hypothetical protein